MERKASMATVAANALGFAFGSLAGTLPLAAMAAGKIQGIDLNSVGSGEDIVKDATGLGNDVTAGVILDWIQNLATFVLLVYVLLVVAAIIIGAIALSTGTGDGTGEFVNGDSEQPLEENPVASVLLKIPFLGSATKGMLANYVNSGGNSVLGFAKHVFMETFKTTLVIVLAWVGITLIVRVALFFGSNMGGVFGG
jgi:hypothetical protein